MRLNKLYLEGNLTPPPRSAISGRIVNLRDKTKLLSRAASGTKFEVEVSKINDLIDRAQKNKASTLSNKILNKAEEYINGLIFKLLRKG